MNRRDLLAAGTLLALGTRPSLGMAASPAAMSPAAPLSAAKFGVVGDGKADDTAALQKAFDAAFADGNTGFLTIPPGTYRITRPLRIEWDRDATGNVTRLCGISARGALILSKIENGDDVIQLTSRATVRFLLLEGLNIQGSGREGHGIRIDAEKSGSYFYNFCLRDTVVQGCGGDGCRMLGNVFEGQIFNSYFRDNGGNGATFGHGKKEGILSALHVFGCVFGGNKQQGVALANRCFDVSFHGCYFLLNGEFGLMAGNGCNLLSNCGFENNHAAADGFAAGGAGIRLQVFGTLVGCTAYSIYNQTHLIDAFITNQLVMIGCTGGGDGKADRARLARLQGNDKGAATLIGCRGGVDSKGGIEPVEFGQAGGGARFGARWDSAARLRLGDYQLWVDGTGRLRIKSGSPESDEDGAVVGA
jgi:hypothetical protein